MATTLMEKFIHRADERIVLYLKKIGLPLLRYCIAVIFIWFGALKIVGMSSANELVSNTIYWFNPAWFVPFLGLWEVIIGLCFLYKPLLREGIFLLLVQMVGTLLPLFILPDTVYGNIPVFTLTLEGQYIIKNIVIIAAAIVIGSHVRDTGRNW